MAYPPKDGHPSGTNRARRALTSFIRRTLLQKTPNQKKWRLRECLHVYSLLERLDLDVFQRRFHRTQSTATPPTNCASGRIGWLHPQATKVCRKITINGTIFFSQTAISILVISNGNSFRVLFVTKLLPYILVEKCINILALETASPQGTGTVPIVSAQCRSVRACV